MDHDQDWAERWARRDNAEIAAGWIAYTSGSPRGPQPRPEAIEGDWWAVEAMMGLVADDPLRALEIVFAIASSGDDPWILECLGAGPLEDLIDDDPTFLDPIAIELGTNPGLRIALDSVWRRGMSDATWATVRRLAGG